MRIARPVIIGAVVGILAQQFRSTGQYKLAAETIKKVETKRAVLRQTVAIARFT